MTAVCEALPVDSREVAPLDAVAVHEAGHAIVGLLVHLPVRGIAMRASESRSMDRRLIDGVCVLGASPMRAIDDYRVAWSVDELPTLADLPPGSLPAYLMMLHGGAAAEARADGRPLTPAYGGSWEDRWKAEYLVAEVLRRPPYGSHVREFLHVIETYTVAHVARHWRWIEATARALTTRGRLSGDEIKALRGTR